MEKLMHNTKMRIKNEVDLHCLDERLNNVEDLLRIKPASVHDVFTRLKNIENRLLFLESSSPEYRHFIVSVEIIYFWVFDQQYCSCFCRIIREVQIESIRRRRLNINQRELLILWTI